MASLNITTGTSNETNNLTIINNTSDNSDIIKKSKFYDVSTNFLDIIPNIYIKDTLSHSNSNTSIKELFKNASVWFSSKPATITKFILDEFEQNKILSCDKIYNQSLESLNSNYNENDYELSYTLNKCRNVPGLSEYNEDKPHNNLKTHFTNFMRDDNKRIFIGFIKLGLNPHKNALIKKLIKKISAVDGHMNCFIVDKKIKSIIRFEPKGITGLFSPWCNIDISTYLFNCIKEVPSIVQEFEEYEILNTANLQNFFSRLRTGSMMPQGFDIYCQTYSIYAALLYCINVINMNDSEALTPILINKILSTISYKKAIIFQKYFIDNYESNLKILLDEVTSSKSNNNVISVTDNTYNEEEEEPIMVGGTGTIKKQKKTKKNQKKLRKTQHKNKNIL